jgi:hypothetical protein
MLPKPCALLEWHYHRLYARSSNRFQGRKCSAKALWALRKSFNDNNLIFQTVEDGFKRSCFALRLAAQDPSHESVEVGFIFEERFLYLALDLAR